MRHVMRELPPDKALLSIVSGTILKPNVKVTGSAPTDLREGEEG